MLSNHYIGNKGCIRNTTANNSNCIRRSVYILRPAGTQEAFLLYGTAFFLAFLGGGFSDTFSAVQVMVWAIALIPVLVLTGSLHKRTLLSWLGQGWLGLYYPC